MPIKFLLLGGFWDSLEGGVEVPILFLWAWGFFRLKVVFPASCYRAEYNSKGSKKMGFQAIQKISG